MDTCQPKPKILARFPLEQWPSLVFRQMSLPDGTANWQPLNTLPLRGIILRQGIKSVLLLLKPSLHRCGVLHQRHHRLHGFEVACIALLKHLGTMGLAHLADLIKGRCGECLVAGTAKFMTGHRLHVLPSEGFAINLLLSAALSLKIQEYPNANSLGHLMTVAVWASFDGKTCICLPSKVQSTINKVSSEITSCFYGKWHQTLKYRVVFFTNR